MSRTFIRQVTQIKESDTYDDTVPPTEAAFETNPTTIEDNLNHLRSTVQNFLNRSGVGFPVGNWFDDLTAPSTLEAGTQRGIDSLNDALHLVEKKRILREVHNLVDVTVGGADNFVILGTGELPTQTTAAVGVVTTLGTVVAAHGGTFGTHALSEVAGLTAINPKNFMVIVDGATRDPILSGGSVVHGLLQGESGLVDGGTITDTTTTRVQISFVRVNATGDDLEAVPASDIQGKVINYCTRERIRSEDRDEQDFLSGATVDLPAGTTVTRQVAYDNQATTPVDLTTNATLDLEGAGLIWAIRDDLEANLFSIVEGSAGGTSQFNIHTDVDEFDVDAIINNFNAGISARSGGTRPIDIGVNDGIIETTAGDLGLTAAVEFAFVDGNKSGSGFAGQLKLSETLGEWDDYETQFGEVSLLNAIVQASKQENRTKGVAVVTVTAAADVNVTGAGMTPNIDAVLPAHDAVTFVDDVDVFLNGVLLRNGADAAANHDVYPGITPANGDLRFEFVVLAAPGNPDVITSIVWGE